jgi:pimeloyl-ACP methyl ester carboxylesterase
MGYRPSAGWGSTSLNRNTGRGGRGPAANPRIGELSEKDGLNVFKLVNKEYPIDPARTYLFGHSAGGAGAWYFGEKFPERFAAVAMSAAPTSPDGFPFDRLKGMPLMIIHGDADTEVPIARSQAMLKAAKENGLDPEFVVIPGATHGTIVSLVEPQVFEFFGKHRK